MKKIAIALGAVIVALAALAGVGAVLVQRTLDTPVGREASIEVSRGVTLRPVLEELHGKGVLPEPAIVYAYARATSQVAIRTGSYAITAEQTPRDVLLMFLEGRVRTETFTLAEGLNRWQVRDVLAAASWIEPATFDRLCDDADFLARHDIPGPSCEGYLFPETYTFARGVTADTILATIFATFAKELAATTARGRGPLSLSERELVTLASIVEKETGAPEERPRIACLFYNRLRAKPPWRMDTDPTVIYAATLADPHFDGNLKAYHLRELNHPYNTYKRYGLPPGPIANPGRAALAAVVEPAECKDFFFVSMNNGHHVFCPTLECHNQQVQKWQVDYFRKKRR